MVDFLDLWHLGREIFGGQSACLYVPEAFRTERGFSLTSMLPLCLLHFPI